MNGSWENYAAQGGSIVTSFVGFIDANKDWLIPPLVLLVICTLTLGAGYLLWALIKKAAKGTRYLGRRAARVYHWIKKRPASRRLRGFIMAKWKKSVAADILFDAIFEAECRGIFNANESKSLQKKIGQALGIYDLLPRRIHKMAIAHYLKNKPKLEGPAKQVPGVPAVTVDKTYVPKVEAPPKESEFLKKLREKTEVKQAA